MSLVHLSHLCSHLQNSSRARLGLTSTPHTTQLHHILLALQRSGYVSTVAIAGPHPPAPSPLNPTLSPLSPETSLHSSWGEIWPQSHEEQEGSEGGEDAVSLLRESQTGAPSSPPQSATAEMNEIDSGETVTPAVMQSNISSRRLWVGLKYWNNEPVLRGMSMVSKPTRRVWMGYRDLFELMKGNQRGYVRGLRGVGESMYVTTDRGIMEVREAVERRTGGMVLCRVNPL